jgi:uncharacterized circularly permuted ATP-grasp superfamily protein/uncharacterized alpha-E superfamily protein
MSISVDTLAPPLVGTYGPAPGIYDEMSADAGKLRPHWDAYVAAISALGGDEMARRWQTARQRIRENGVTYNIYGDPLGMDRPWNLDAIPLLISPNEWRELEAGLIQRARLLNWILADIYGPQKLLRGGHLPPAIVFANPGFWRPCHGLFVPDSAHLHLLAVDLARSADGQWWVLSDRTQAPSGAGYALENRIVLSETFPDMFREFQVQRLASFFRAFRNNMLRLSTSMRSHPRVVLLTPGPLNETYFEHSYLARYLGFTLAQGGDLTVRDSRVFLKTLAGLKQVDVILRRVDSGFCDPIELRSDSFLGVAGLVEALRAGNVVVANALGSGLTESPAFMPFLPGLCRRFLGEKLRLPSVATWWCGQPEALDHVRQNLDSLVIKPSFPAYSIAGQGIPGQSNEPVFGGRLAGEERRKLLERMQARPYNFTGQELVHLSTAPVWSGTTLAPRQVVLRVFVAAAGDSWIVMPGGLTRVSPSLDSPVVSMQRGGGSKDTWVLSDTPVDIFTMQRSRDLPVVLSRGGTSDLPSRAADNLFWLGRYAERCEHLAQVLRCILVRLTGETSLSGGPEWNSLMKLHAYLESEHSRMVDDDPQGHLDLAGDFEQEILSLIFEEQRSDSLYANLNRTSRAAASVRDRLSSDLLRVVSQLGGMARIDRSAAWGYVSPGDALAVLNRCIGILSSLRGIELENITRGPGWHFLGVGRRIERSVQLVKLFRAIIVPLSPETWPMLEMLLEVCDSSMTYRSRYFTVLQAAPVLDLLMNDETNPRSLAFQVQDLSGHCAFLARTLEGAEWPLAKQRRVEEAAASLFEADVQALCQPDAGRTRKYLDHLLAQLDVVLPALSDAITNTWFSHAEMERLT